MQTPEPINSIDLTNENQSKQIIETANFFLQKYPLLSDLRKLENDLIENKLENTIASSIAAKLACSKKMVQLVTEPLHISVVFAVYKEHHRILKNSEHPHGENFLIRKIQQMRWLFEGQELITWDLTVVDDGCPEKSGEIAQKIINENSLQNEAQVIFLNDAIKRSLPIVKPLSSTDDSRKGGSILYGMWNATQKKHHKKHIIAFTDADLSTHLGQLMLLADPIINQSKLVAIGSRREKHSVVVKNSARNNRGKLFIYLWKRMIPKLGNIIDTQCGFKAFNANIIPEITLGNVEHKFAFDVELLIKTELLNPNSINKVPIAWIDSEAASTTTDLQPYLPMLKSIAKMQEKYFSDKENQFADFVNSIDENDFKLLIENIPQGIVSREPDSFAEYKGVSANDLRNSIKKNSEN